MRKILSKCEYTGKFNDIEFTKVLLVYSENGQYPKLIAVNKDVYDKAEERHGKLVGRDVEMYYEESYGKYKVSEIKPSDPNKKPIIER